MSTRARDGTRWIDGKLFVLRSVHEDKETAREIAQDVREGKTVCGHGNKGPHYARVVKHNWNDRSIETDDGEEIDMNRWAVFAFPKEGE